MENKIIPTAEEFLKQKRFPYGLTIHSMTEFAKMHVELALKEAEYCRTKECIQKCYPLDKIE